VKVIKIFNKLGVTKSDFKEINEQVSKMENYYLNYDYAPVKARSADVSNYGNNHYEGPDASHGTHVAGLIAAERSNNIGARGIASNCVEIMSVRTVPDGDERDLDIANAIHYAVDNGANIINMSFGKELSPHKAEVDAAIRYAAEKNVLIVHAAGNDSENNDEVNNFPNPIYLQGGRAENYLTVGASSISKKKDLIAEFSNYGKEEVDLFAPGKEVYSTMPDNAYKMQSGTSMASPVAVGVAALVWAYHPELTAIELKQLLMDSCTNLSRKKVKMPGDKSKIRFGELSQTGGIINAYNALMMADSKTTN
jgi:cell wall-associated protease